MIGPALRLKRLFLWILATLLVYVLVRFEFIVWNHRALSGAPLAELLKAFFIGLRFDLSAVFAVSLPIFLLSLIPTPTRWVQFYDRLLFFGFGALQAFFLIFNMVDVEFIHFVGRRTTAETLFVWGEATNKIGGFLETYWVLYLVNAILMGFFWWLLWRLARTEKSWRKFPAHSIVYAVLFLALSVLAVRGGFQKKPITFVNANVFASPLLNNFVLNSTFTFIKSFGDKKIPEFNFFPTQSEAREEILKGLSTNSKPANILPSGAQTNVVIVIMESFGSEYTAAGGDPSYTPFLDSLAKKSLYFPKAYANARRSIEGIAAIMAGLPALMNEPFVSSQFTSNEFIGLGTVLKEKGYHTAFFHGGMNGTMYFDSFTQSAGLDHYFGLNEYPERTRDFDGTWGIWDGPFFNWTVEQISQFPSPFLASVFSLSSHHPFRVPPGTEAQYPEGPIEILKSVRYADDALKDFFAKASQQPWYGNTLFVITADHTSLHFRPEFDNVLGSYWVPVLFYHPRVQWPSLEPQRVVSQVDIMPTILDVLGESPSKQMPFGQSIFREGERFAVNFLDGVYYLFGKDHYLKSIDLQDAQLFDRADLRGERPLIDQTELKNVYLQKLRAHAQFYNNGMLKNQLYEGSNSSK